MDDHSTSSTIHLLVKIDKQNLDMLVPDLLVLSDMFLNIHLLKVLVTNDPNMSDKK